MLNLNQQILCLISFCMLISILESAHHERHIIHVPVFVHFVHHHHKIIQKRPRKGRYKYHYNYKSPPFRYHQVPPGAFRSLPVKHIHHVPLRPVSRPVPLKSVPKGKGFRHNHVHVYHAHPAG